MKRSEVILRSMLAYIQRSPAPDDVMTVDIRKMSTDASQARYENMAAYIDRQLDVYEYRALAGAKGDASDPGPYVRKPSTHKSPGTNLQTSGDAKGDGK